MMYGIVRKNRETKEKVLIYAHGERGAPSKGTFLSADLYRVMKSVQKLNENYGETFKYKLIKTI